MEGTSGGGEGLESRVVECVGGWEFGGAFIAYQRDFAFGFLVNAVNCVLADAGPIEGMTEKAGVLLRSLSMRDAIAAHDDVNRYLREVGGKSHHEQVVDLMLVYVVNREVVD